MARRLTDIVMRFLLTLAARRILATSLLVLLSGGASVLPGLRDLLCGAAGSAFVALVVQAATRSYSMRHDDWMILRHEWRWSLRDRGCRVVYVESLKVRSLTNLKGITLRLHWTGESSIAELAEAFGDGVTLRREVGLDGSGRPDGTVLFKLDFRSPLRRWRTKKVGLRVEMHEPAFRYSPSSACDTGQYSHGVFARMVWSVEWDNSVDLKTDQVEACEYRHRSDATRDRRGPLGVWPFKRLVHGDRALRWSRFPGTSPRYCRIEFPTLGHVAAEGGDSDGSGGITIPQQGKERIMENEGI